MFDDYIFLHITKTGGYSMVTILRDKLFCPPHTHIKNVDYEGKKVFYITRNPYTRLHSQYNFYKYQRNLVPKNVNFSKFIMEYDTFNDQKNYEYVFKSVYDLTSINGEHKGYKYLKFENLNEDFENFSKEEWGKELRLPHLNINNKKEEEFNMDLFTDEMLEEINSKFHMDFEFYNYKKYTRK
jgi:hypothetical protein